MDPRVSPRTSHKLINLWSYHQSLRIFIIITIEFRINYIIFWLWYIFGNFTQSWKKILKPYNNFLSILNFKSRSLTHWFEMKFTSNISSQDLQNVLVKRRDVYCSNQNLLEILKNTSAQLRYFRSSDCPICRSNKLI